MSNETPHTAYDEVREALRAQVKREGPYKLASGAESDWYLDCRPVTFTFPMLVAKASLWAMTRAKVPDPHIEQPTTFAGVVAGGVPIASALACSPFAVGAYGMGIRPEPKDHGASGCVMGIPLGTPPKIVIVDDVFTSGGSLLKATDRLAQEWDLAPVMYLTLFNRNEEMQGVTMWGDTPFVSVYGLDDILGQS